MGATKEQAEKTKENILRGALQAFSERGLEKTRLENIVAEWAEWGTGQANCLELNYIRSK